MATCSHCGGKGEIKDSCGTWCSCSHCDGKGRVPEDNDDVRRCSRCGRKMYMSFGGMVCGECEHNNNYPD